ncbi:MAG: hypothetical protein HWN68_20625, partial [Desulfobacterales bacterium]|nr:hypothetical protein [Desulfobacterales bacterium]
RSSDLRLGQFYSIQPTRTSKGISDGKIWIIGKLKETRGLQPISEIDAKAEGGYTPEEYERLYEKMHPNWRERTAYHFVFFAMGMVNFLLGKEA